MKYLKYISIFFILTGCVSQPVNISKKYEDLAIKKSFEFTILNQRINIDKLYFTLSIKNISKQNKIILLPIESLTVIDSNSNLYSVFLDGFLGDKKSLEICIKSNETKQISLKSPIDFFKQKKEYILYIKKNITSQIPICFEAIVNKVENIKEMKVRSIGTDSTGKLKYIGYFLECKNKKKFYFEFLANNQVTVNDMQKKKQILEFNRDKIDDYLSKICTY